MKEVLGEGPLDAKLWLIGEAPGETEERIGRPFIGGAGSILDGILSEVGIHRQLIRIENVSQVRPDKNNFNVFYNGKNPSEYLIGCHNRIKELIRKHKPNVVVPLGNEALFAITGDKGITKWRGSILNFEGTKVIPTIHPAMVMRQYEYRPQVVFDLARAKEESLTSNFPQLPEERFILSPSFEKIMSTLSELNHKEYVTFDIETINNQIDCIGFGWSKSDAICIPLFYGDTSFWTPIEEQKIVMAMKQLFANTAVKFIAQNSQFDMTFLHDQWGIRVANLWMDTMIAHHCVYPELPKALSFLVSIYTKRPFHKDDIKSGGMKGRWEYNCRDCVTTWEVAFEIQKEAIEFGTWDFYREHSHKLIKPLFDMQLRGVKIDIPRRDQLDKNLSDELATLEARLNKVVGKETNARSPKQLQELLYNDLNLPKQYNAEGNVTTGEDAIEYLNKNFPNPIFDLILDIRKVTKLLSTYVRAPLDTDGRMRCSYVITGTDTGRLSSRENIYGSGTNLQNIPRGELIRSLYIPDEGMMMVNADLSQAEARVVAYLAEEERLIQVFEEGGDIHVKNAAMVFKKHPSEIVEREREIAKRLVHSANYKVGNNKFALVLGCGKSEAQEMLNKYFALFPRIKVWHMEVEETLRKTRTLVTPLGRKRMFFGRWGDDLIRAGIAHVPQSTVGDILNDGLIRIDEHMPDMWSLLLQNHDAVMAQVPIDTFPEHIHKFFHHYLEIPIHIKGRTLVIPCDIKVGPSWGKLKGLKID